MPHDAAAANDAPRGMTRSPRWGPRAARVRVPLFMGEPPFMGERAAS